jgi:signal transduction histidine kinase/CheY-like chemotaxis protein
MNRDNHANPAQRLALELQAARQGIVKEQRRAEQLDAEVKRLQAELEHINGSRRDEINSRLQAEEALGETQERLQLALDAAALAMWDVRYPFTDVYLCARGGEMLGNLAMEGSWSASDLLPRIHPHDMDRVAYEFRRLLHGEVHQTSCEYRFKTNDEWIWLEAHAMVVEVNDRGKAQRVMGTQSNITRRKQIEEKVVQARALAEQASRSKSEFLANISHEIRTPLNAIMGLNQLLLGTELTCEQQQWLHLMSDSSHVLLDLLNDVLDFSRIEAGKLQLEDVTFPLRPLFESAFATYVEQARQKSVLLTIDLDNKLPEKMTGDPLRLRQVLTNLLSNAVKFTPAQGSVTVTAKTVAGEGGSRLVFAVSDTGIGIDPRQQRAMFEAFTQADSSTARRHGGSGLGLAICSSLVKMMGGTIWLRSSLGEGSSFEVALPLREVSPVQGAVSNRLAAPRTRVSEEELAAMRKSFTGLRVLMAEDNAVNERFMRDTLSMVGCEVRVARNGEEAVRMWEGWDVELILMDAQMPGVNGLMATSSIRERERASGRTPVPILAVTANAMSGDRETYMAAGMNGYVAKPIDLRALFRAMSTVLKGRIAVARSGSPAPSVGPTPVAATSEQASARLEGLMGEVRAAIAPRDSGLLQSRLEALQACLAELNAEHAMRICRGLDMARHAGEWGLVARAFPLLETELAGLLAAPAVDLPLGGKLAQPPR